MADLLSHEDIIRIAPPPLERAEEEGKEGLVDLLWLNDEISLMSGLFSLLMKELREIKIRRIGFNTQTRGALLGVHETWMLYLAIIRKVRTELGTANHIDLNLDLFYPPTNETVGHIAEQCILTNIRDRIRAEAQTEGNDVRGVERAGAHQE